MEDDDQDIYDVAPPAETSKTVGIGKLKTMFENNPMAVHTPAGQTPKMKASLPTSAQNKPTAPLIKPKPVVGKFQQGFQQELLTRQKIINKPGAVPSLPQKDSVSINASGEIVKSVHPTKPNTQFIKDKPPMVAPKNFKAGNKDPVKPQANNIVPNNNKVHNDLPKKDTNVPEFIGEPVMGPNNDKYRMTKCSNSSGPPPPKPGLPRKIDIEDILQQYAVDDDMYDDVITDDSSFRPVSIIPEFTEEDELGEKTKAQKDEIETEKFEQEVYDEVRVKSASRKSKSVSIMSTGSDIYESFDEVERL